METKELIERCRKRDADALGELYRVYAKRMRGVCRRYVNDEAAIDDVLHDAFVIIFTSFDHLRDDSKAEAWMMSIARNVALKYRDHLSALKMVPLEEAAETATMSQYTAQEEVKGVPTEEVLKMVERLPDGYSQVFRLSVFEGMTHRQIASMLGIEPHSSSSQLARAKKLMRKMMQQYWAAVLLLLVIPIALLIKRGERPTPGGSLKVVAAADSIETSGSDEPKVDEQELRCDAENSTSSHKKGYDLSQSPNRSDCESEPFELPVRTVRTDKELRSDSTSATDIDRQKSVESHQLAEKQTLTPQHSTPNTQHLTPNAHHPTPITHHPSPNTQQWSLELAYAGQLNEQNSYNQPFSFTPAPSDVQGLPSSSPAIPSSIDNWMDYAAYLANNPDAVSDKTRSVIMRIAMNNANQPGNEKILRTSHHQMPVTWSLALKYRLDNRFGLESGLSYSRLTSDFETGADGNSIQEQQTIHYLGIPVKGIYNIYNVKAWSLYGSLGLTTEIPVHTALHSDFYVNGQYETSDKTTLRAPWQFSTTLGLGLQYHLTPSIGLFAEPSLQYYIPMHSDIETYRTEHPLNFTLPLGIRFTW